MARNLTLMQMDYCRAFASLGSETRGNKSESAKAARYRPNKSGSGIRKAVHLLNRNENVQAEIKRIEDDERTKWGSTVVLNIMEDRMMAKDKKDVSSMLKADELLGKHLGIFFQDAEQLHIEQRELSEQEQVELDKYIDWKHQQMLGGAILKDSIGGTDEDKA